MQKFTVFSILLSLSILLIIGDILFHDYLTGSSEAEAQSEAEEQVETLTEEKEKPGTEEMPEGEPEETEEPDAPEEEIGEGAEGEALVELSEGLPVLSPRLSLAIFEEAGFLKPVLKDTVFSGLVFQFISFSDQTEATIYQWNLFDGEQYIGSVYEMRYGTETGSFQAYLALRERAMGLDQLGTVNEVNNYGDASLYFNHKTKVKTVHLIFRSGSTLWGFEYAHSYHEKMKKAFDSIVSLL